MALVVSPVWDVSVSLVDRDRNVSSMGIHVPGDVDFTAIVASMASMIIPAIGGISNATVKAWSISRRAVDAVAPLDASEDSDVERKGVFSFRAADGSPYVVNVPSFLNSKVVDRVNLINILDVQVAAFIAAMVTGDADVLPTTYLGSDLIALDHARKHHRGSRRG
jgi:hypothetical protein